MNKHVLTINYHGEESTSSIVMAVMNFLLTPYKKGKKYKQSEEITAKLPILEALLDPYCKETVDKFIGLVNNDIKGLADLIGALANEMEKQVGQKYKVTFNIEKLGE